MPLETWEMLSYVVTVIGLPMAILVFIYEQRKERENEEEEVYQLLSDNYQDFLKVALEHTDLRLFSAEATELSDEQRERMIIIFTMLISLFERAYLLMYGVRMSPTQVRRWRSWDDYMHEWCRRADFRAALPSLLSGEDPEFADYIQSVSSKNALQNSSKLCRDQSELSQTGEYSVSRHGRFKACQSTSTRSKRFLQSSANRERLVRVSDDSTSCG